MKLNLLSIYDKFVFYLLLLYVKSNIYRQDVC